MPKICSVGLIHQNIKPLVRLEAMIDARIDKALARLLDLKEYKRIVAIREPPSLVGDFHAISTATRWGRLIDRQLFGAFFGMNELVPYIDFDLIREGGFPKN